MAMPMRMTNNVIGSKLGLAVYASLMNTPLNEKNMEPTMAKITPTTRAFCVCASSTSIGKGRKDCRENLISGVWI